MSKLESYCRYKTTLILKKIKTSNLRKLFTCMRLSSHQLEIEMGRYSDIDRKDRLCKFCNQNAIESEYHFIFVVVNTQVLDRNILIIYNGQLLINLINIII